MTEMNDHSVPQSRPTFLTAQLKLALIITFVGTLFFLTLVQSLSRNLPSLEQLERYQPRLITKVLGNDGTVLKEFYTEQRVRVPLDSIAVPMLQAVLATEDRNFYHHWGIDPFGIMRALVIDISTFSKKQGASTITQQLARNLYLHRKRTIRRKLMEIITAVQIERTYSKNEILQMYLNQMYFGHGTYGVQKASQKYFGVSARDLDVSQAAVLTALLKAPAYYSPRSHPQAARQRRDVVLANMRNEGYISNQEYQAWRRIPIEIIPPDSRQALGIAPYFTEWVRQDLENLEDKYGFDYYKDGLQVQTSLDPELQSIAEAAVDSHLTTFQEAFYDRFKIEGAQQWLEEAYRDTLLAESLFVETDSTSEELRSTMRDTLRQLAITAMRDSVWLDSMLRAEFKIQVAFIAMDPKNGNILAMIGGRDFNQSKFNRAVQALRQPGSCFKPFVYTTAIDNGIYANHRILNMVKPVKMPDGTWWRPENYSTDNRSSFVSLREALRRSLNNVTVRMVSGDDRIIPITEVIRYAHRMGIRTKLQPVLSLALGSNGVIPLDIVTAYGVFASGGIRSTPRPIISINDHYGVPIVEFSEERETALSSETAYIMTNLLSDVINRGTGGSARWKYKFYAPAAGKTGTTNNFTDAWFVGFTPHIVAGVWVGFDNPKKSLGAHQSGARAALPVWAIFMRQAYKEKKWDWEDFEKPVGVVEVNICEDSGEPAGPYCPKVVKEVFRRGDEPTGTCSLHRVAF